MLYFVPAIILLHLSGRYICPAFLLGTSFLTLSTLYLVMRFNQIHQLLDNILCACSLEENIEMIQYFIRLHRKLTIKTFRYNHVIKWYLLVAHYTFGGVSQFSIKFCVDLSFQVLGLCIFTLIAASVPSIYITIYLVLNVIVTGSLILIISGSASMIHSTTTKSYHKLSVIYVAYERFYDQNTRDQLIEVIESISSSNKPISFYCHEIFPFKKSSLIEVCLS